MLVWKVNKGEGEDGLYLDGGWLSNDVDVYVCFNIW